MKQLPKQVARQVEAAEAALTPSQPPVQTPAQPPVDVPPAPAQPPAEAPAAPAPEQQFAPVEPAPAPRADTEPVWEQRFRSLQGVANRQMSDAQARADNAERAAKAKDDEMRALQAQLLEAQTKAATAQNPQDAEVFGADLVDMVTRTAKAVAMAVGADLAQRVAALENGYQGTTQAASAAVEDTFLLRLIAAVPDWEQVNLDQGFLAWLNDVDPVYGATRQAALDSAANAKDSTRVAAIFNAFKATRAPAAPPPTIPKSQLELQRQIAPDSGASTPPVAPNEPQIISQHSITAFYRDVAAGKYRGRDDERRHAEALIDKAMAEGRIR